MAATTVLVNGETFAEAIVDIGLRKTLCKFIPSQIDFRVVNSKLVVTFADDLGSGRLDAISGMLISHQDISILSKKLFATQPL